MPPISSLIDMTPSEAALAIARVAHASKRAGIGETLAAGWEGLGDDGQRIATHAGIGAAIGGAGGLALGASSKRKVNPLTTALTGALAGGAIGGGYAAYRPALDAIKGDPAALDAKVAPALAQGYKEKGPLEQVAATFTGDVPKGIVDTPAKALARTAIAGGKAVVGGVGGIGGPDVFDGAALIGGGALAARGHNIDRLRGVQQAFQGGAAASAPKPGATAPAPGIVDKIRAETGAVRHRPGTLSEKARYGVFGGSQAREGAIIDKALKARDKATGNPLNPKLIDTVQAGADKIKPPTHVLKRRAFESLGPLGAYRLGRFALDGYQNGLDPTEGGTR